jgi:phage shock protein A
MFSFVWENWKLIEGEEDGDLRRNLFLSMDHVRERLSKREQQIDRMDEEANQMRDQIERLAAKVESNTAGLQSVLQQTRAVRFLSTIFSRIKRRFSPH